MTWTPKTWAAVRAMRLERSGDDAFCRRRFRQSFESSKPALREAMEEDLFTLIDDPARSGTFEDLQRLIAHLTDSVERDGS